MFPVEGESRGVPKLCAMKSLIALILTGTILSANAADTLSYRKSAANRELEMRGATPFDGSADNRSEEPEGLSAVLVPLPKPEEPGSLTEEGAVSEYDQAHRYCFQRIEKPLFVVTSKNCRYLLALGGSLNLRAGYDFGGIVDNPDFVPYDIPVPGDYATRQKLIMDATTSRIFIMSMANVRTLGRILVFVDMDFRGGERGSYMPRLRTAYITLRGFTFGRDVSTFCDLQAAPMTVDFLGPNAYNFDFATMIRYEASLMNDRLSLGIAAEMTPASGTYGQDYGKMPQRVPDIPAYVQYTWGDDRESHVRASGVLRTMYLRDRVRNRDKALLGWGVQFSGRIRIVRPLTLFMSGVYGQGITPYIQDISGSGLDFAPDAAQPGRIRTTPMWGWQAAAEVNPVRRLFISGGYSTVGVECPQGCYSADRYKRGDYLFGNVFYLLTPRCRVAGEYLYGTRTNMNGEKNHANRINLQVKYNF